MTSVTAAPDLTSDALRTTLACFPSGVVAACAVVDGDLVGMAISSFASVSLDPPLVAVFVQRGSSTWPTLRRAESLGISVLGEAHVPHVRTLAARDGDRFAGLQPVRGGGDAVFLEGAAAWLEVVPESEAVAGDHLVVMLRVVALTPHHHVEPLLFHRSLVRALGA